MQIVSLRLCTVIACARLVVPEYRCDAMQGLFVAGTCVEGLLLLEQKVVGWTGYESCRHGMAGRLGGNIES